VPKLTPPNKQKHCRAGANLQTKNPVSSFWHKTQAQKPRALFRVGPVGMRCELSPGHSRALLLSKQNLAVLLDPFERRWIIDHLIDHWINRENTVDSGGPAPHFRDGHHVFFPVKALEQWAESRAGTTFDKVEANSRPVASANASRRV